MVMIVPDAILIQSGRACRLDPPQNSLFNQQVKGIVNSLSGDGSQFVANQVGDFIGGGVGSRGDAPQNRQPLGCDLQAVTSEEFCGGAHHDLVLGQFWTL